MLHNRDGGRVEISGAAIEANGTAADTIAITVRDTGPGIPDAEQERVFERFYRLDQSRGSSTGGSGLGLAICREVIGALGGSIRIAASSSAGTTFEITLPGRAEPVQNVAGPLAAAAPASAIATTEAVKA